MAHITLQGVDRNIIVKETIQQIDERVSVKDTFIYLQWRIEYSGESEYRFEPVIINKNHIICYW